MPDYTEAVLPTVLPTRRANRYSRPNIALRAGRGIDGFDYECH